MSRIWRAVSVIAALVIGATLCVYMFMGRSQSAAPVMYDYTGRDTVPRIMAADSHGAVLVAGKSMRGVSREHGQAWVRNTQQWQNIACTDSCPNVVLSGDMDDLTEDVAPIGVGETKNSVPTNWLQRTGGSNNILNASANHPLRFTSVHPGDAGTVQTPTGTKPLDGMGFYWTYLNADSKGGVLRGLQPSTGASVMVPYALKGNTWVQAHAPIIDAPDNPFGACVADGGRLLAYDSTLKVGDKTFDISKTAGTNCAFANNILISWRSTMQISASEQAPQTTVTATSTTTGKQLWQHSFAAEVFLATASTKNLAAISDPIAGNVQLFDAATGHVFTKYSDKTSGQFDEKDELVLAGKDGRVSWVQP